jgi:hypothetical protein
MSLPGSTHGLMSIKELFHISGPLAQARALHTVLLTRGLRLRSGNGGVWRPAPNARDFGQVTAGSGDPRRTRGRK